METELELTFSLQVPCVAWLLGSLMLPSPQQARLWGFSVKGAASKEGAPVVAHAQITTAQIPAAGQLLHCFRGGYAGHGDLENDVEWRWPLRGTLKFSRSDPAVHQH